MTPDRGAAVEWLRIRIAEVLDLDPEQVPADEPFVELGLSSFQAVRLSDDLQEWAGVSLPPTLLYDFPTIDDVVRHMTGESAGTGGAPSPAAVAEPGPWSADQAVAIVGIGCRLPGADSPQRFWDLLCAGVDAVGEVPAERWNAAALYDPDPATAGRMNTRWGGFLDDVTGFDAAHFGISAREAARMDPQQRISLEVAVEALADAGIATSALAGSGAGVYLGASTFDHGTALLSTTEDTQPYDGTGSALSIVANRISYCLNLQGPSMVVDTACSSSLVAVHLACQALRTGETGLAIAGGVNVITSPRIALSFSRGGLMAADGRCKPFDHRADGYVRSEGAGIVVLKPLSQALEDRDRIYAVLLGGAVNQDGRTNGLTAPNRPAQEAVLRAAYRAARIEPSSVDYVEAHGTGTAVGDPIEVGALAAVLGEGRPAARPLRIGSAKSNLGHLEAAAGVTGLIKTALALAHRAIPPTVHFEKPNPLLRLDRIPVVVAQDLAAWPEPADPAGVALAGVSSFGFGGTNAHLVLSAPPAALPEPEPEPLSRPHLFTISAGTPQALRAHAHAWSAAAREHRDDAAWPARAAAAAALRTDHDRYRAAVVAADHAHLSAGMDAIAAGEPSSGVAGPIRAPRRPRKPVLVFPGQGSQWAGMGRQLAAQCAPFREAMRACDTAISKLIGRSLWDDEDGLVLDGTACVQPALFATQVALAATWQAWGLEPAAVVGHSMGEIAAAYVSGALSLEDSARIACERSGLLAGISGAGGLALLEAGMDEAAALVAGSGLSVAAVNGPRATVVSGAEGELDELIASLTARGVFARRISVEFAAHSPQVEPLQPLLHAAVAGISPGPTRLPLYSTVTGGPIDGADLGPDYWARNLREPVLFAPAVEQLLADGYDAFVEVAPHPVLARPLADIAADGFDAVVVSSMRRDTQEVTALARALGELHCAGTDIDWSAWYPQGAARTNLPVPGWDHQHFPIARVAAGIPAPGPGTAGVGARPAEASLLGGRVRVGADPSLGVWTLPLSLDSTPELADHVVEDVPLVPGAYWLTAAAQAARAAGIPGSVVLEHVVFPRPCPLGTDTDHDVQIALRSEDEGRFRFTVTSWPTGRTPVVHAEGTVRPAVAGDEPRTRLAAEPAEGPAAAQRAGEQYVALASLGLHYGPRFRGMVGLHAHDAVATARVRLPEGLGAAAPLHPALLDSCLHAIAAATPASVAEGSVPLPAGAARVWVRSDRGPLTSGWCTARITGVTDRRIIADVTVFDEAGDPVWAASGFEARLSAVPRPVSSGRVYDVSWRAHEPAPPGEPGGWLVVSGGAGLGRDLADRLTAAAQRCVLTATAEPDDLPRLLAEAQADGPLRGVLDLRALEPDPDGIVGTTRRALSLAGSLAARTWPADPPRLWLLTGGTHLMEHAPAEPPFGAALWGLGRVFANEHPDLGCSLLDLAPVVGEPDLDALCAVLCSADPPAQAAIRGGRLMVPRLRAASGDRGPAAPVDPDLVQVVTGGLGALGLQVARWLADRGARNLLLLGRSEPTAQAAEIIGRLDGEGVRVRCEHLDVGDPVALGGALDRARTAGRRIGGVFHLAGSLEDALFTQVTQDSLERALRGKAVGAWNLHTLTRDDPVTEFVLFSSLAGLFGSPGQAAYAAANTFLDSLAGYRAALGLPAVSLDWGPWAGAGLAVQAGSLNRLAARGYPPIQPGVAFDLLDEALAGSLPQVCVAAFALDELADAGAGPIAGELLADLSAAAPAPAAAGSDTVRDTVLALDPDGARRAVYEFLVGQIARVLNSSAEGIAPDASFQDLGFDSLMAIELRDRLERALSVKLSATLVYSHPSAGALAGELLRRITDAAPAPASPAPPPRQPPVGAAAGAGADEDLSELDDDQVAALLAAELDALGANGGQR